MQFYFEGRDEPIKFGKDGSHYCAAVFNSDQDITKIQVSKEISDSDGKVREFYFFDSTGKEVAKWEDKKGTERQSLMQNYNSSVSPLWPGKEVDIPAGHQIVGFAVQTDAKGFITWVDLKVWKPPTAAEAQQQTQ